MLIRFRARGRHWTNKTGDCRGDEAGRSRSDETSEHIEWGCRLFKHAGSGPCILEIGAMNVQMWGEGKAREGGGAFNERSDKVVGNV